MNFKNQILHKYIWRIFPRKFSRKSPIFSTFIPDFPVKNHGNFYGFQRKILKNFRGFASKWTPGSVGHSQKVYVQRGVSKIIARWQGLLSNFKRSNFLACFFIWTFFNLNKYKNLVFTFYRRLQSVSQQVFILARTSA